jgi:hypothetical protein
MTKLMPGYRRIPKPKKPPADVLPGLRLALRLLLKADAVVMADLIASYPKHAAMLRASHRTFHRAIGQEAIEARIRREVAKKKGSLK